MTRLITAFLAVALLTLTACTTGDPKPTGLTTTSTDQGIELTASIASATFAPGAVPQVDVTVRNSGKTPVRYIRYNGCDMGISVWMEQGGDKTAYFNEKSLADEPRACTETITSADLEPGGTTKATYRVAVIPDQPPPANGDHFINVSFNRGAAHGQEQPVVAALKVTILGGEARVTEAEALAAAKADARMLQWLKAHPDGPVTVVRWHQDRWLVRFASKVGPTPHEVEVAVKGAPAKIESVTWR